MPPLDGERVPGPDHRRVENRSNAYARTDDAVESTMSGD
jgi:hypothetical protein